MPLAAKDEFGLGNAPLGLIAEARYTVLAEADDRQPAVFCNGRIRQIRHGEKANPHPGRHDGSTRPV